MGYNNAMRGFTLVELLVVVSITIALSGLALTYSRTSERQVAMHLEAQKIAELIFRAKSLAITTYNEPGENKSCGYGFEVNYSAGTYSVFSYEPPSGGCINIMSVPVGIQRRIIFGAYKLPARIVFNSSQGDRLRFVLFVPPAPRTLIGIGTSGTSVGTSPGKIYLETADGLAKVRISVSLAGQIDI